MDIAKYIGLFLLKNRYCYIHGLGNMELKKKPAVYDGTVLQPSSYEVVVTPGGSIDDNLASLIALNEQTSISKAANALRDYSVQARTDLQAGKEVALPNIGKFVEKEGRIQFITDEKFSFTPPGIPTTRNSKRLREEVNTFPNIQSFPTPKKVGSVNWSMVILVFVLLIIIGGGIYGVYYMKSSSNNNNQQHVTKAVLPVKTDTIVKQNSPDTSWNKIDTIHNTNDSLPGTMAGNAPAVVSNEPPKDYKVVIGWYKTKIRAEKRYEQLKDNGDSVEFFTKDSTDYLILTKIRCSPPNTPHVLDSLRVLFGYKATSIYKP